MTFLKAILFDLDGTLVDSVRDLQEAVNTVLAEEGLRAIDEDETKSMVGDGAAVLVKRAIMAVGGDPSRSSILVNRFLEVYEANASCYTEAYPGVRDALEDLKKLGLPLAVVTNKPYRATIKIVENLGIQAFFRTIIGGDTLPERKPHPAPILLALKRLGVNPETALMVGDNYHDVQAARAAGVSAFAVTYGYSHKPHAELGADRLLTSLSELVPIVKEANAS